MFAVLFKHAVDAFVTSLVMSAGMDDDRPVGFSIKLHGAVIGPVVVNLIFLVLTVDGIILTEPGCNELKIPKSE